MNCNAPCPYHNPTSKPRGCRCLREVSCSGAPHIMDCGLAIRPGDGPLKIRSVEDALANAEAAGDEESSRILRMISDAKRAGVYRAMESPMPKTHVRTAITVEGKGAFPIDMLRYDDCTPAREIDAGKISRSVDLVAWKDPVQVNLHRFSVDGKRATAARWESFGWTVVADSGKR